MASAFEDVDGTPDRASVIRYLDALSEEASIRAAKRRRDRELVRNRCARVLDVGCGTGDDARNVSRLLRPPGTVVGIDSSDRLIELARSRVAVGDGPVRFVRADAHALPFCAGSFDAVRAERVLQHVGDPGVVVAEMARVLRPEGRLVTAEPDWGGFVLDDGAGDAIGATIAATIRHGRIGRALRRLHLDAGLRSVSVRVDCVVLTRLDQVPELSPAHGMEALRAAAAQDRFLAALPIFEVCGEAV